MQTSHWLGQQLRVTDRYCSKAQKKGQLMMHVLDMPQTVGIDYHLFKSETKAGQLR